MFLILFFILKFFILAKSACPNGWITGPSSEFCYKLNIEPTYWTDADYNCILLGGHLASISDAFTNTFLNNQAKNAFGVTTEFWLGSTTMIVDGQWSWSDSSNGGYFNWGRGQPVSNNVPLVLHNISLMLNDFHLTYRRLLFVLVNGSTTRILENFIAYNQAGYPTFDDARQFCKKFGADDIVSIGSEQENTLIQNYVVPFSLSTDWFANDVAMIGLSNNGTGWKWLNDKAATFTNWLKEPQATDFGWVKFMYGSKQGYRGQWVYGGTFWYDGCAVFICERVMT